MGFQRCNEMFGFWRQRLVRVHARLTRKGRFGYTGTGHRCRASDLFWKVFGQYHRHKSLVQQGRAIVGTMKCYRQWQRKFHESSDRCHIDRVV
jgi:hypothetical protein